MEILTSRILLRPADLDQSRRFYRDVLGLAVYREFGPPADPSGDRPRLVSRPTAQPPCSVKSLTGGIRYSSDEHCDGTRRFYGGRPTS